MRSRTFALCALVVLGGAKTDPKTCEDMSQSLGDHEVERENFSRTRGAKGDKAATSPYMAGRIPTLTAEGRHAADDQPVR